MQNNICQLHCINKICEPLKTHEIILQLRHRLKRILKRRLNFIKNLFFKIIGVKKMATNITPQDLQPGDVVRIRSMKEIKATLNEWNQLKGCVFMEEMWALCDTTHKVLKRVEIFLDERSYRTRKCKGIVLLEGVICNGTKDFGPCDRSCFFFWKEEWLEKVE